MCVYVYRHTGICIYTHLYVRIHVCVCAYANYGCQYGCKPHFNYLGEIREAGLLRSPLNEEPKACSGREG